MINAILAVLVLSVIVGFTTYLLISILAAITELSIREIFSPKLFSEIRSNLATSWSIKSAFVIMVICMIALAPCAFDAAEKISAANRGECTYQCRKCKVAAEHVEAVIRYLELDDKDLCKIVDEGPNKNELKHRTGGLGNSSIKTKTSTRRHN